MKQITIGIVAHVDAGKTTLSESLLYTSGALRSQGRVDHGDAFLDNFHLERERGITIFSKIARLSYKDLSVTLLDTPGHVDFSAEMERVLHVLDYAVLVIGGNDGIQSHTETLWRLLKHYHIPTFLFINKMDLSPIGRDELLTNLKDGLDDDLECFNDVASDHTLLEAISMHSENAMNSYLETGAVSDDCIASMIKNRVLFPCYFGSALKNDGVTDFLDGLSRYTKEAEYPAAFGASVFKIAKDAQGKRLTYLKITGGSLRAKQILDLRSSDDHTIHQEKVDEIRLYSGEKYTQEVSVSAGTICTVTGLTRTYPGEGLGIEPDNSLPLLEPVMTYQVILPEQVPAATAFSQLKQLSEELPELQISWADATQEIRIKLMGRVQTDVFASLVKERFGYVIEFGPGRVLYKETITDTVEGIGHFEPLKHYAEVHLRLEPGEPGSGLIFDTNCREEILAKNWQRLIMTHLSEREHPGVLTGSPITDMKITLISGRAHTKHTEGGDFRQATYRALRQGLKKASCKLLEPYYQFRLSVPTAQIGRIMTDLQNMHASFDAPLSDDEYSTLSGHAPAVSLNDYPETLASFSAGRGQISLSFCGYGDCHNADTVIEQTNYDSEMDLANPTGSVFCAHGAGFVVPWNEVERYMHVESMESKGALSDETWDGHTPIFAPKDAKSSVYRGTLEEDKELDAIFERTFGPQKKKIENTYYEAKEHTPAVATGKTNDDYKSRKTASPQTHYLLVDGYNIIFSWDSLKELSKISLDAARGKLMDIMCNYQGYVGCELILVFDAYKVKGNPGSVLDYHNIHVVYTKEAETADMYIEKTTHVIGKKHHVTVATSDGLEQIIVMGEGAYRISAREFYEEVINRTGSVDF